MGEVRLQRKQLILFKNETTYGVDAAPSEANSNQAVRLVDPFDTDMGQEFIEVQPGNNTRGFNRALPTFRPFGVTFRSYVTGISPGSAYSAAVKPPLADLLRACGLFESFVTSDAVAPGNRYEYAPGASVGSDTSVTLIAHHDGYDQRMLGCRGNVNFLYSARAPVIAEFTFRGLLSTEAETARGTASFLEVLPPAWIDSGSIIVTSFCLDAENLNLNTNNQLMEQKSACAGSATGIVQILITERAPGGSLDPAAPRVNTSDVIGQWRSASESILRLNAGVQLGNKFTVNASLMVYKSVSWQDKEGLSLFGMDYQLYQRAGNDEFKISFYS